MDTYRQDMLVVAHYGQSSADALYRIALFAHGTVQQATENLTNIGKQYDEKGFVEGDTFSWRMDYIQHFSDNRQYYYNNMMKILRSKKNVADRILELFLEADGLGLAKASFVALLATGMKAFACLDSNLMKWYGLDPKITDYNKKCKNKALLKKKRQDYLAVVKLLGGGIKLFKEWCIKIAEKSKKFTDGIEVSNLHVPWFIGSAIIT